MRISDCSSVVCSSDLACAALCAGQGIVEAEVREKALSWLPDEMRFGAIEKPESFRSYSAFLSDEDDSDGGAGEIAPDGDAGDFEQIGRASRGERGGQ